MTASLRFRLTLTLACALLVALGVTQGHAQASASCLVACKWRAPVRSYRLEHHEARCETASCRVKAHRSHSHRSLPKRRFVYPCRHVWTWDSLWYHNFRQADGHHTRNQLGRGSGYLCVAGQP